MFDEPAFLWRQEDLERGCKEETLIEFEIGVDLEIADLPAGGVKAVHGLAGTLPAVAYPSSVRQLIVEHEDIPIVRYPAHLPSALGEILRAVKGGQCDGEVEI